MNENKVTTYGDLRQRKQELRDEMDNGDYSNVEEYQQIVQIIRVKELFLLYSITSDESCGELVNPKVYKRVKYAVIAISIAVILSIVLFGCTVARESLHLVGAVGEDVGWIANKAADNIRTEK